MGDFQKILVIDSAMNGCNAAYYDGAADACFSASYEGARGQAERLVPMVQDVIEQGNAKFDDVQAIVVVNGPGTFTGIRIALSSVRAFGFSLDVPVYGVTSLQALALCYVVGGECEGGFSVIVETRRADFYVQGFDGHGSGVDEARSVMAQDIGGGDVIGDAAERLKGSEREDVVVRGGYERIQPCILGAAFCDEQQREAFFVKDPEPIYLRAPDVSLPKNPPRKLA